jgi:hypothetical protein
MAYSRENTVRRTFASMQKLPAKFLRTVGETLRVEPRYTSENGRIVLPSDNAEKYVDFIRTDGGVVGIMGGQRYVVFGRE